MPAVQPSRATPEAIRFGERLALGFRLLELGLHEEAAEPFRQAVALRPADPVALGHLALCLWRSGEVGAWRSVAARLQRVLLDRPGEGVHLAVAVRRGGRPTLRPVP
jgi:hypothetical protein